MLLQFPDFEILTLSLTTSTIPDEIAVNGVESAVAADKSVWVKCDGKLPRPKLDQLKAWNVQVRRSPKKAGAEFHGASCWPQILPLQSCELQITETTPVLFELRREQDLADIVREMLRQGNDRQQFRYVSGNDYSHAMLRVIGPPYYSMLRAFDPSEPMAPRAFVERKPRVWVEAGFQHPLESRLKPAAGQHLLLENATTWRTMKETPFQDIYDVLEFTLEEEPADLQPSDDFSTQVQVPLQLRRGTSREAAEVFVITENAEEQLDSFVHSTQEDVLRRLLFAAVRDPADKSGPVTIVIKVRPGKDDPPVLVFDGLAYRSYAKIPNLFVPENLNLHPSLRRDALRKLLAPNNSQLVWLQPDPENENQFAPRSVDESALQPLHPGWVEYVIDQARQPMKAWKASHQFDFDDLICADESSPRKKAKEPEPAAQERPTRRKAAKKKTTEQPGVSESSLTKLVRRFRGNAADTKQTDEQQALIAKLESVEREFLALDAPLEAPEREASWQEMALLNTQLSRFRDASVCLQHLLWEQDEPSSSAAHDWFMSELAASVATKTPLIMKPQDDINAIPDATLQKLFKQKAPSALLVSQVAAWVVHAGSFAAGRERLSKLCPTALPFLQRNLPHLSLRAAWLSVRMLSQVANDSLALARTRDRILERLFQHGLSPDRDLPAFLRTTAAVGSSRFRAVREHVVDLHEVVQRWSDRNLGEASDRTHGYVDLIFGFAYARLGESTALERTLKRAKNRLLEHNDDVHAWLYGAFRHRINQALSGQRLDTPLPPEMEAELDALDRTNRYNITKLRKGSSILDPHEERDPYRDDWTKKIASFENEVAELESENNPDELAQKIAAFFEQEPDAPQMAVLITKALELSGRLGEVFACGVLERVVPLDKRLEIPLARCALLEKGLHVAATYDRTQFVRNILSQIKDLLNHVKNPDVKTLGALERLMSVSFRILRKLRMREEIIPFMEQLSGLIRSDTAKGNSPEHLQLLLQLAANWNYLGDDRGEADMDTARQMLLSGKLASMGHVGTKHVKDLTVAYLRAVGEAPLEESVERIRDLFENQKGVHDHGVNKTHFSLKQLDIVDALGRTIVSDGFVMNKASQRWLDDEEYLIRRRVQNDLRAMVE